MSIETIVVIEKGRDISTFLGKELSKPRHFMVFSDASQETMDSIEARYNDIAEYVPLIVIKESPELDGVAAFYDLRSRLYFPNVMIVTDNANLERSIALMKEGCTDYLISPGLEKLQTHVERVCEKSIHKITDSYDNFELKSELAYKRTLIREIELKTYVDQNRALTDEEKNAIRYSKGPSDGCSWEEMLGQSEYLDRRRRVLIVDDEEMHREALSEYLCDDYQTEMVSSADDALQFLKTNVVDLVLLDIRMEGMSGDELLRQIRHSAPNLSVIMVTAYPDSATAVQTIGDGALEFLNKHDYTEETLLKAVKRGVEATFYRTYYMRPDVDFDRRTQLWNTYYEKWCRKSTVTIREFYVFFPEFWVDSVDEQLPIKPDYALGDMAGFIGKMKLLYDKEEIKLRETVFGSGVIL